MQLPIGGWRHWPLGGACLSQGDYAALDPPKQRDNTSRTRSPCEAGLTTTLEKCSGSVSGKELLKEKNMTLSKALICKFLIPKCADVM